MSKLQVFKPRPRNSLTTALKGWFATPIQWEDRNPTSDWSPFFGKYQNQKWGNWDTDSCWCLSVVNAAEDQLEWLHKNKMFSQDALDFFTKHGYIDSDGDFSLSERFLEIKGGRGINGGTAKLAWQLIQSWGCIPRSMLSFVNVETYFNPSEVTPAMELLGEEFKKHVNTAEQKIANDKTSLRRALQQAPLTIGIPIPRNVQSWNAPFVKYDGSTVAAHEIELYGINSNGEYLIFDQYEPHLKVLSSDYLLVFVTQGILYATPQATPNPIVQPPPEDVKWYTKLINQLNNALKSFYFQ